MSKLTLFTLLIAIALFAIVTMATTPLQRLDSEIMVASESSQLQEEDNVDIASTEDMLTMSTGGVYVVQSGDTLSGIGARFGCTVAQLQSINNIPNANQIYVGQRITLCGSSGGQLQMKTAGFNIISNAYGALTTAHKNGINTIVSACNRHAITLKQCAYLLATTKHETAHTYQPVREAYWRTEAWRRANLRYYPYYGRGYVQLTWRENYQKAGDKLGYGSQFVNSPDRVMDPTISANILARGCKEGWFTGAKLSTYISATKTDYTNARRIVNGTDRAALIAGYAVKFESALKQ